MSFHYMDLQKRMKVDRISQTLGSGDSDFTRMEKNNIIEMVGQAPGMW